MKKITRFSLFIFGCFALTNSSYAAFSDVPADHQYYKAISYLEEKGVLEGYADGNYLPDELVNRVEALKIALLGSGIDVPELNADQEIFPDVLSESWYAKYVFKGKDLQIVNGDGDTGMFRPGDPVQLDEILKMLVKAKNIETTQPSEHPYWDVPPDTWSAPYFYYAKTIGMFPQPAGGGNVEPAKLVTRGLMADLMYQLEMKPQGYEEGVASFYGIKVQGAGTASGERFDAYDFTAAHKTLPFGTMVLVRNLENDKTVTVRINDRGPYTEGRIIDLSQAAFEAISPLSRGVIPVSILPLRQVADQPSSIDCSEAKNLSYISKDSFENIVLDQDIPNRFVENEVLYLSGVSKSEEKDITAFVVDEKGRQFPFYTEKNNEGRFAVQVFFPNVGNYKVGVLAGESGSGSAYNIKVLSGNCLSEGADDALKPLSQLSFNLSEGDLEVSWQDDQSYELTEITFIQGEKRKKYMVYGEDKLTPHYADFDGWSEGFITIEARGGHLEGSSVLDADKINWSPKTVAEFRATKHHDYQVETEAIKVSELPSFLKTGNSLNVEVDPLVNLRKEALIILPSGHVESIDLTSETHNPIINPQGISIFPATTESVKMAFKPQTNELHFLEINDEEGIAVINIPIYPENLYPLLPNPLDFSAVEEEVLGSNLSLLQTQMLDLVNKDRAKYGFAPLKLDAKLSELAQSRTDDMVERQYLSHWNPEGLTANDLRKNFAITQFVSENIARDSGLTLAQYGLMRSALHRENILDAEWKRAGFGVTKDPEKGGYIFVQIFSDDPIDLANLEDLRSRALEALNEERTVPVILDSTLNEVTQGWSERMVEENFFNFTAPDNQTLVDVMRDAGISGTLGTYIIGNSSFDSAVEKISSNPQLQESRWEKMGIGIKQDKFGIIKFTLAYIE